MIWVYIENKKAAEIINGSIYRFAKGTTPATCGSRWAGIPLTGEGMWAWGQKIDFGPDNHKNQEYPNIRIYY